MVLKIMVSIIFVMRSVNPDSVQYSQIWGTALIFCNLKKNLIYCKILSQLNCLMIGISVKCEFVCTVALKYLASPRYSKLKVSLSQNQRCKPRGTRTFQFLDLEANSGMEFCHVLVTTLSMAGVDMNCWPGLLTTYRL